MIDNNNSELSKELKSFIKDEDMAESKNFDYTDLIVLNNVSGTISKMDEVLDGVKEYFKTKIGKTLTKDSARSTGMKNHWYSAAYQFYHPSEYLFEIQIAFMWWNEIYLGIRIYIDTSSKLKNTEQYLTLFKKVLKGWSTYKADNYVVISNQKPIAQFIIDGGEQIPAMVKFLKESIDKIETLKTINPRIFD